MMIDAKNGDTQWKDSEDLELKQIFNYDSFQDLGKGAAIPEGYTKIRCHFVYNCKHDGRFKSQFCGGREYDGHSSGQHLFWSGFHPRDSAGDLYCGVEWRRNSHQNKSLR